MCATVANISAALVAELRQKTGMGFMLCKNALVESNGNIEYAEKILRINSGAKASKVADRVTSEGLIAISIQSNVGAIIELNCETDFVAKDESFIEYSNKIAENISKNNLQDIANLLIDDENFTTAHNNIIAKLGENIILKKWVSVKGVGKIHGYVHSKKIGVLVDITNCTPELGKDICMHIAASKPAYLTEKDVPADGIENEKAIYIEQARQSGKNDILSGKIAEGKINKYLSDISLLGQDFIKNPDIKIRDLLNQYNATVNSFVLFTVGGK